jgi:hypothetical protein
VAASRTSTGSGTSSGSSGENVEANLKNALFLLMCAVTVVAAYIGFTADSAKAPNWALGDNRVYRGEIALAAFLILYAAVIVLWLAAHKLTLKSLSAGPVSSEIPQATQGVESSAARIEKLSGEVRTISNSTSEELAYHDVRLKRIEDSMLGRLLPGEVPPPPAPPEGEDQEDEDETTPQEDGS